MTENVVNDTVKRASPLDVRTHVAWVTEAMEAATTWRERSLIEQMIDDLCRIRASDSYVVETLLQLRRRIGRLSISAFTDPLTGLRNRRGYMVDATALLDRAQRTHRSALIICVEIDELHAINESLGWTSGDAVLRRVAQALERTFGVDGVVGRISGNEFAATVITESPNRASTVLRLIQYRLASPLAEDTDAPPSVSVGLSMQRPGDHQSIGDLLAQADQAMCVARRLVSREGAPPTPVTRDSVSSLSG